MQDCLESVTLVCQEPKRALSEATIKMAMEMDSGSDYLFGLFSSREDNNTNYLAAAAVVGLGLVAGMVVYLIKHK